MKLDRTHRRLFASTQTDVGAWVSECRTEVWNKARARFVWSFFNDCLLLSDVFARRCPGLGVSALIVSELQAAAGPRFHKELPVSLAERFSCPALCKSSHCYAHEYPLYPEARELSGNMMVGSQMTCSHTTTPKFIQRHANAQSHLRSTTHARTQSWETITHPTLSLCKKNESWNLIHHTSSFCCFVPQDRFPSIKYHRIEVSSISLGALYENKPTMTHVISDI